ncbi:MAG: hypothetical protein ACTSR8_21955 [Promethearchaeota archaeon]
MKEADLKARIGELETELENKEHEIIAHLDKIEQLEETVMRLEALIEGDNKKGKKGKGDSKLAMELDEKDREIRELKDKLGYLRKEKIQLQQELEKVVKKDTQGSVIRIKEKKSPLDSLVNELQDKLNKQRLLITKLKQQAISADAAELTEKLREKEEENEVLKANITELESKLKGAASIVEAKATDNISKALTEELQTKLNKAKRQIEILKQKLEKKGKGKKAVAIDESVSDELHEKIDEMREQLDAKNKKIAELKTKLESTTSGPTGETIPGLTDELQNKLNKARVQIKTLQEQLKDYKAGKTPSSGASEAQIEEELKMQKELMVSLQQELEDHKQALQAKDGEIIAVKNEAVQNQLRCEDLENVVKLKEQKIEELRGQLAKLSIQAQTPHSTENSQIKLRIRELKSMIEDLNKQNIQQRLEISQLRNI